MFVLIRSSNIVNSINVFVVAFLIYFVISKRFLIIFFETSICLRNLSRLCLFKILFFLFYIRMYVIYSLEMRHCQNSFLISLIIFVYFVIYSNLTFLCTLAYELKFSIVFFRTSSNFVVYLLMSSLLIKLFNINLNNKSFSMSSNFFKFIAF